MDSSLRVSLWTVPTEDGLCLSRRHVGGLDVLGPDLVQDSSHGGTCQPLLDVMDVMDVMDWSRGVPSSPQETSVHFLYYPLCCLLCENRRHGDAQIMLCFWEAPQPKR